MKLTKILALALSLMLLVTGCSEPTPKQFEVGDIVVLKLTGQKAQVIAVDKLSPRDYTIRVDNGLATDALVYEFELEGYE